MYFKLTSLLLKKNWQSFGLGFSAGLINFMKAWNMQMLPTQINKENLCNWNL